MIYRAIGHLSDSSGSVAIFAEFHEKAGEWSYELIAKSNLSSGDASETIRSFIVENNLQFKVALITLHSDVKGKNINAAAVAAATSLPVITDLPAIDIQLGGNGEFFQNTANKLGISLAAITDSEKAVCVALMGILRWREEYNFLSSITGASRNSIGGAVWLGQEA